MPREFDGSETYSKARNQAHEKAKILQQRSDVERAEMEKNSTQIVTIIYWKKLWGLPDLHSGVSLRFKIPLRAKEIQKRIHDAFPELSIQTEGIE